MANSKDKKLTPLQEEALENLKIWMRNPAGINLGAALGYSEFDIHNLVRLAYKLFTEGKMDDARTMYEGIHALDPTSHDAMMGLGTIYAQQGHLEQAIELFTRIVTEDPEHKYVLLQRGECYIRQQNFEPAVADFKAILTLDPEAESPEARRALGIIANAQKIAQGDENQEATK